MVFHWFRSMCIVCNESTSQWPTIDGLFCSTWVGKCLHTTGEENRRPTLSAEKRSRPFSRLLGSFLCWSLRPIRSWMCFPRYWTSFPRMKIGFQLMFLLRFHIIIHYVNLHCVYSIHYHRLISLQMIHKDEDFWPHDFFLDPFSRHDLTAMCNNYGCQFWCIFLFKSAWVIRKLLWGSVAKAWQKVDNTLTIFEARSLW